MNRRGFFSLLGAAAVAPLLPTELWTPKRTIFLPPVGGWTRGNSLLTVDLIVKETVRIIHQNMQFVPPISRQYDDSFASAIPAMRMGDTVRIRMPTRYGAFA